MRDDGVVIARLRGAGCVFAEEEARLLASTARTPAELDSMVSQREQGLPLEQIVGWAEFRGFRILVDPGVFVPRRRSEFLVETALDLATTTSPVIVDLCCGTGALGLAVATGARLAGASLARASPAGASPAGASPARASPAGASPAGARAAGSDGAATAGAELHATDIDPAAVACARRNVEPAGGHVYRGDLFGALPPALRGRVNVLICNAPYVPSAEIAFLPTEARDHEPLVALDGGLDGLAVLRRAALAASGWLAPGGVLLVETSGRQAAEMASAMSAAGLAARVHADDEYGATVITGSAQP